MDAALHYTPAQQSYDLRIAGGDIAGDATLSTSVLLSLLTDRLADASDVLPVPGERRGWWADSFAAELFGSRLWLLGRSKQLQATVVRCKGYVEEALAWLVADGFATSVAVEVTVPRMGWLVAAIDVALVQGGRQRLRFVWSDTAQVWTLAGEA